MNFVRIDPPGTFCNDEALRDIVRKIGPKTFVEIGCGGGHISKLLCSLGLTGTGLDFSKRALAVAAENLTEAIESGKYRLIEADAASMQENLAPADIGVSYMVLEHVEDDVGFVRNISPLVRSGGTLIVAVPGRKDCWSFEDETVGHLRRYEREDLKAVLESSGLSEVEVWSVAVPTANFLAGISDWIVRRSTEAQKLGQDQREQTETSGIRDIPWKTVFPPWVKIILNRFTLYPLFVIQRLFYRTGLGIVMVGFGRVA